MKPLLKALNSLANDPEPSASSKLGGTSLRRLRVGIYRAACGIAGTTVAVKVFMVGSTAA